MSNPRSRDHRYHHDYGERWEIAAVLMERPKTVAEIEDHFHSYLRFMGLFRLIERWTHHHQRSENMREFVQKTLKDLVDCGWVIVLDSQRYALTPKEGKLCFKGKSNLLTKDTLWSDGKQEENDCQ